MTLHAKITAYNDFLIFEQLATKSIDGQVTTSLDKPGLIGQAIHNTKEHLGVSKEAIELIGHVRVGRGSIGDIDWFHSDDGNDNFGWLGGPKTIKYAGNIETARGASVLSYIEIPNDVPVLAKAAIDAGPENDEE